MKKAIALLMSIIITGGAVPAAQFLDPTTTVTAKAANWCGDYDDDIIKMNLYDDGHAEVTECKKDVTGTVVVPEMTSSGHFVTMVNDAAFNGCENVENIVLPDTIKTIGKEAFGSCKSLKDIDLSDNLTAISDTMFYGCESLKSIEIPETVNSVGTGAFWNCTRLRKVNIPEGVKDINYMTFAGTMLTSITLPKSVQRISRSAFDDCGYLKSITIMNPDCLIGVFDTREDINTKDGSESGYDIFNKNIDCMTIYCEPGSTASEYANDKGISKDNTENVTSTTSTTTTTTTTTYKPTAEGFVIRMYNIALNRNPDPAGLKSWTTQLNNRQKTAADIISAFFNSNEYENSKKTSEQMVVDCYKAMLNRAPDAKGKADWAKKLDTGMTINAVCKGIVGSQEFKNVCKTYGITPGTITIKYARDENYDRTAFVYRLYTNCLGRTPDAAGLENWCKNLKNGTTGAQAVKGFFTSKEFTGRKRTNRAFVETVYRTMLGRAGDAKGINSWTTQLSKGKTRINVINGFLGSGEFKNACAKAGIKVGSKI